MAKGKSRNAAYDVIRILAILMVLYNHRAAYTLYQQPPYEGNLILMCLSILCKCGPTLFFMISGALLLWKTETPGYICRHRMLRILIVMAVLSVWLSVMFAKGNVVKIFFSGLNWYLYAYLAYLIMLPVIRALCQNMSRSQQYYFLICALAVYGISGIMRPFPVISESVTSNLTLFNASWASACWQVTFPILGFILASVVREGSERERRTLRFVLLAGTIIQVAVFALLMQYDLRNNQGANLEQLCQHGNMFPSCLLFYGALEAFSGREVKILPAVRLFSEATFGMFLIETHSNYSDIIFGWITRQLPGTGPLLGSLASVAAAFILYGTVVILLRMIPFMKKIL